MVCAMEIVHVLKSWTFTHWVSPSYKLFLNVKFTENRDHNWTFSMETLIWMSSHGPGAWFIRSKNSHLELIFFFWEQTIFYSNGFAFSECNASAQTTICGFTEALFIITVFHTGFFLNKAHFTAKELWQRVHAHGTPWFPPLGSSCLDRMCILKI